jgi:hypothetical protein
MPSVQQAHMAGLPNLERRSATTHAASAAGREGFRVAETVIHADFDGIKIRRFHLTVM